MPLSRRSFLTAAGAAALYGTAPVVRAQQNWPERNVRLLVPYPAGGSSDIIARAISQPLSETLKQTVIVDNRPGANGNLGAAIVAQSGEDRHTLLLCDVGALMISPSVYTKLSFDPNKDLRGVSMLAYSPHILAVHPSVPVNTLPELVALSKRERLNFAVTAMGSAPHVAGVAVEQATHAEWQYVPYKGGSQAITDTIGGQTQIIMNGMLATLPHVQSGKLKAIAVSSRNRMPQLPNVATIAEQGVPGFESGTWQGLVAPASMSPEVLGRLSKDLAGILNAPALKAKLAEQGADVVTMTPAEMDKWLAAERQRWAVVVQKADIRLD
ncbi:Bug family tripartite tricarboxylate transporter substrate binding protein [Bordetella genomosp. 11]|uniref:ABC transporter substrate-binding protein n=1 Tax=Bordetella genomosp. 11 TaxID=1416808 RepID=A0A261UCG6_9BORD|nr:tripartite tricarboxylate transporter substrate binding protein [Bordetella genomosp. 11]OZI59628.1 ABC transporter substrate-binding protein [Bordetella genomosp. 11]